MKKFLQGLAVLGCCTLLYFWFEGAIAYSKTKKVPYVVREHTLLRDSPYLVIDKGSSNTLIGVTVKEYIETRNGDLYYVEEKVDGHAVWKDILFELIPMLIAGLFVIMLIAGLLIAIS